ncbi:Signal peptidase subunit family protein [Babesia bovis T2Bo]|uniref:Signal peptidase complex subunit 3 n=1 Tax=Babesia bovis TaxID=5865 RepID=A7AMR7_BABBO|nr:Signal peptidase subunit family protein [Babesia bovis T2Bo]EDO07851.1 Signal peptidase subunit family protein [Babesia bovis T2Bo]BAN65251.1 signal peptidase family protein [Babesia bovis]|eukprot:XP_001611419.1 signal peptidase family protein [Babesia bovis T2Bo]
MTAPAIRCYTVLSTSLFALWAALALNYLSGQYYRANNPGSGSIKHIRTFELKTVTGQVDRAAFELNLSYDLRDVFDWSANVIFLYATVNYETPKHPVNELIIFDKIITSKEEAYEPGADIVSKYYMIDYARSLRKARVTLRLHYCFVPIGGLIKSYQLAESVFTMPSDYVL